MLRGDVCNLYARLNGVESGSWLFAWTARSSRESRLAPAGQGLTSWIGTRASRAACSGDPEVPGKHLCRRQVLLRRFMRVPREGGSVPLGFRGFIVDPAWQRGRMGRSRCPDR